MIPGTWQLTERWMNVITAVIASGIISTMLTLLFNWRRSKAETEKLQAEADKTHVETAGLLVDDLSKALQKALERRDKLLVRVETLEADSANLTEQIGLALKRIGELECEVAKWKKRYHELLRLYNGLTAWIEEQGLTPPPELKSTLTMNG
jgi:chromosome segregation ATPase